MSNSASGIPLVLLAGGLGTRMREETEFKPKPMVEVGGRPVLWHIMKNYASSGVRDFVVCAGYRGSVIKEYFLNYEAISNDFTINLGNRDEVAFHGGHEESDWNVTVANTGEATMTGGRVFRIKQYAKGSTFFCTYGDGLADVDVDALLKFHRAHGKIATVTTIRPSSRFGVLDVTPDGLVESFREKPQVDGWVNAGFFAFEQEIFNYLDAECVLEQEPLARLASEGQLAAFKHEGFWQPMDTFREYQLLNDMWDSGTAPWKKW